MQHLKPMDAVVALYSTGDQELAEQIVASLSHAIFSGSEVRPAGNLKSALAGLSYRVMRWTTKTSTGKDESGTETTLFRNALLERSGHPYARSLLASSRQETAALVEGGDPMNGPYMMIPPAIRKNGGRWDTLFFDSVQGRDVQSRIIWETHSTYQAAKRRLEQDAPVRLKAVAAGTGLSLILVYDKLIRDGYDPHRITASITDRDEANMAKTNRLLGKLATTRDRKFPKNGGHGISAEAEDIFRAPAADPNDSPAPYDVVTAIGIFEYFHGFSYATTEPPLHPGAITGPPSAQNLARRLAEISSDRASLIVNTYRGHASTRILELFGKKFVYRNRENLRALLASADFSPAELAGSGHIYDVEVYEKNLPPDPSDAPRL